MAPPNPDRSKLLGGITVLDFIHIQALAGPTGTRILSDPGAKVIKLEPAPNGELSRSLLPIQGGWVRCFFTPVPARIVTGLIPKVDVDG